MECTAISISPLIMATSNVFVKTPVTPNSYRGLSKIKSPVDFTGTNLTVCPKS